MRVKKTGIFIALILIAGAAVVGSVVWQIGKARKALIDARKISSVPDSVAVESHRFSVAPDTRARLLSQPFHVRDFAQFHGLIYAATSNGLISLSEDGKQIDHWTTLDGLPSQDLTSLAVFNDSLWIGTSDEGLIRWKDHEWTHFLPRASGKKQVHALLSTAQGKLLAGTSSGILVYDDRRFSEFAPTLKSERITTLAGDAQNLFAGTFNNGLFTYQGGISKHLGRAEGLRDTLVNDLETEQDRCYIATADGLQVLENGSLRTLATNTFITSLSLQGNFIWAATRDRGLIKIANQNLHGTFPRPYEGRKRVEGWNLGQTSPAETLITRIDNTLISASGSTISIFHKSEWKTWSEPSFLLTNNNISTLLKAKNGELWIGYFDHGLDVLSASKDEVTHFADENLFCINHISEDHKGRVYVSTANGLVVFQPDRTRRVYRTTDGLLSDRVMETLPLDPDGNSIAIATAQGFTLKQGDVMKSIFAFHGLVNNHVYTMAFDGREIYLGTLGGISQVSGLRVTSNFTQMDSGLKANWVNAMLSIDNKLFIGTYGSGIQVRTDSGQWLDFSSLPDNLEINPNALYYDGTLLFCGTLDSGIYIYNTKLNSWKHVAQRLPSLNVTAFASDGDSIYIGTDRGLLQLKYDKINTIPDLI